MAVSSLLKSAEPKIHVQRYIAALSGILSQNI